MKQMWKNMKPVTRVSIIVCVTAIVMALIFTGQLTEVFSFITGS